MASNTIVLKGNGINKEAIANAAITPGYLVERMSTGNIRKHATAGVEASPAFAIENEVIGLGIDDDYAANDNCLFTYLQSGSEVFALLAAAASAIVIGDKLESAGDGTVRILPADVAGVQALITFGAGDAAVTFKANAIGANGNDITIQYIAGTAGAETVVVTGLAIVIKSDTTTPGTSDQADDIIALVNADIFASALVFADEGAGDGTDAVVTPVATTNLAGGVDTTAVNRSIGVALEAVDNSGGGGEVRIKMEVF